MEGGIHFPENARANAPRHAPGAASSVPAPDRQSNRHASTNRRPVRNQGKQRKSPKPEHARQTISTLCARMCKPDGSGIQIFRRRRLAGEPGFEPRLTESESVVLPLNYSPPPLSGWVTGRVTVRCTAAPWCGLQIRRRGEYVKGIDAFNMQWPSASRGYVDIRTAGPCHSQPPRRSPAPWMETGTPAIPPVALVLLIK